MLDLLHTFHMGNRDPALLGQSMPGLPEIAVKRHTGRCLRVLLLGGYGVLLSGGIGAWHAAVVAMVGHTAEKRAFAVTR